jgi:hypothetical protein
MHEADHGQPGHPPRWIGLSEPLTQTPVPGRVIWCLGMYASASTWLFNIVRQVLEAAQKEKIQLAFVSGKEQHLSLGGPKVVTVIKSHEISNETRSLDVARSSEKILITVRDPRDAVTSLMQAHKYKFDLALYLVERSGRLCVDYAKDRRAKLFRYETRFFERAGTVTEIARHLGYELPDHIVQPIHVALTRAEVEKHINQMPKMQGILRAATGDLLDPKTHWHSHHAGRNGEVGKWRKALSAQQANEVERRLDFFF